MDVIARAIAGRTPGEFSSAESFWDWHVEDAGGLQRPVDRAIAGGAAVDRLGYAFAAGYAAALHALVPELERPPVLASLAATEEGGAHPRAIRTTLTREGDHWRLSGHKRWVTLAGTQLLVLAKLEEAAVRLKRPTPGRAWWSHGSHGPGGGPDHSPASRPPSCRRCRTPRPSSNGSSSATRSSFPEMVGTTG